MRLCIPTLCNYEGVDSLIQSAEAGTVKPSEYVILDNGGKYAAERIKRILPPERHGEYTIFHYGKNLGVARSWNKFLSKYGEEPIVISNDDILFGRTAFEDLVKLSEHHPRAGFGWALFMQRPDCTARVGYYDENFWPAYYEDIDYIIRMAHAGVPDVRLEGKIDIHHSSWTTVKQLGDPDWLANGRMRNLSYLVAKWGTDNHGGEYPEPFAGTPPKDWGEQRPVRLLPLRWDVVNEIAVHIGAKSYLELGVADGSCLRNIQIAHRTGVDMAAPADAPGAVIHQCTTDEFFRVTEQTFDVVFVDADHDHEQAYRDVQNAIAHLNPGGVVVMHDCSPFSESMQIVPHNGSHFWTGNVWKTIVRLRWEGQHAVRVVDSNFGIGIVIPGGVVHHLPARPRKPELVTYQDLVRDRQGLLGLVSGWEWQEWFKSAYAPASTGRTIRDEWFEIATAPPVATPSRRVEQDSLVVVFTTLPRADTTGAHLLKAFERWGVRTVYYEPCGLDGSGVLRARGYDGLDLTRARAVLFVDDDHGYPLPTLPAGIRSYYWCIDSYRMDDELYLGGTRRARKDAFDKVFYAQSRDAEELEGEWLPLAVDTKLYRNDVGVEKLYDFCFIGNHNVARAGFIDEVKKLYPNSFVGNAYGEEANRIYNQSRIALNCSAGRDLNMRMFEGQATSALLISNRIDNGEDTVAPVVPLYASGSVDDCKRLMDAWLVQASGMLREFVSNTQANLVAAHHTYEVRARRILRSMGWLV